MDIAALYKLFLRSAGVYTDTRHPLKNGLFFALSGPHFDANSFALEAVGSTAVAAVVSDPNLKDEHEGIIVVLDPLETLQKLANYHRRNCSVKVIGLTGSNGKTTTKELMTSALQTHYKTQSTIGNLNNHIGVPLTLLDIKEDTEIAIVEMGANHQGEIAALCEIAEPDWGYITNFGKAHMEGFGGVEGIIKGKSELYRYLENRGKKVFCNGDDSKQNQLTQQLDRICFGKEEFVDYRLEYKIKEASLEVITADGVISSALYGSYNLPNIAAAFAVANYFKVPFSKIQKGIASYQGTNNRSQTLNQGSTTIVLDAYNANPTSMKVALESFFTQFDSKRVLILGDMLELGDYKEEEHQAILNQILKKNFERLFLIGESFSKLRTSDARIKQFESTEHFLESLKNEAFAHKNVLVKGSRGLALERVLSYFKS